MSEEYRFEEVLRRHALPEVLFSPDIASALGLTTEEAEKCARAGVFGREFYVGGRVAVLRQDLIEELILLGGGKISRSRELLGHGSEVAHGPQ